MQFEDCRGHKDTGAERLFECLRFLANVQDYQERERLTRTLITSLSIVVNLRGVLIGDQEPLSFYWTGADMNGAIVFHGDHDGHGAAGQASSVSIVPVTGWEVHS